MTGNKKKHAKTTSSGRGEMIPQGNLKLLEERKSNEITNNGKYTTFYSS